MKVLGRGVGRKKRGNEKEGKRRERERQAYSNPRAYRYSQNLQQ